MSIIASALASTLALTAAFAGQVRAGSIAYADPAGDATALGNLQSPRTSDAELDLLQVAWATTTDELVVTTRLTATGVPPASNGWAIAHYFTYEDIAFELLGQEVGTPSDLAFGDGVYLRPAEDTSVEFACVCRMVVRPESKSVEIRMELNSLGTAARTVDPRNQKPSAGSTLDELSTTSYRVAGFLLVSDRAAAPESSRLTV
jgi:hypothetical protein